MKRINGSLLLLVVIACLVSFTVSFAAEARVTLVKVAGKGMRLSDVISAPLEDLAIIQQVNGLSNPYDLKEGIKIMVPDKAFIEKAKKLEKSELSAEVSDFRSRISEKVMKEVNESFMSDAEKQEAFKNEGEKRELQNSADQQNLKKFEGQQPAEFDMRYFPKRPKLW